ncbi:MAG TPA: nucleotidyltransferase family protein [Thermoanaerobaculia bacterium]|nr:nucleotidyltransferase family protein [Thermoanaerobaculia bacterium]
MPPELLGPVAGILLAAGTSSRMGSNKLLFEFEGESLLRRAARRALAGGLAPLLVVLGHQAERAREEIADLAGQVVVNPDYEQGITSSLQAGVAALTQTTPIAPAARAAVVMLADMPFVTAEMIAGLVARYRETAAPLVISDYGGVTAPPMLYDRALFGEILNMTGGCGKQVVKRHRGEAEVLSWPPAALADLDLPDDWARLAAASGAR